ncbi:zinc-dependent metalloprotease [Aeromicrobium fastidiosum]|uniref:zinc-dependent metalloprotease n=1 Tax=Aeromicrobium fastidiosum TaxID=52699 RepID=UPI00202359A5|nr:zinc-dependent metalloprotease [Aeromicrobium fastidiosum]MCL8250357.1 zinc-dependent metalloprotease [Aeromicrobium fastidiosum]
MADDDRDDAQNPFKGTPMEQIFGAFSSGQIDMNQIMGQMQKMFAPHEGSVNFDLAKDVARQTLAAAGPDPSPTSHQQNAVDDAARLAELWLDTATSFPAGATTATAWSKAEWIEATAATWQQLVEPIAQHVVTAMSEALPDEAKAMAGPLMGMLSQAGGAMFGQQVGQALGGLAGEVVSSTDIGLPLGRERVAAVIPSGVAAFGEGLEHPASDVLLYVVLRECAHHRLFQHSPWLRSALVGAIEEYGRGTRIDVAAIESQMRGLDPSRPEDIQEALAGGLFEPERTPEQQRALDRLETLLAFIEGWVDEVVAQATAGRMPAATPLAEAMRRRRATGGPAEQTFAALVGLELRPRKLREATSLWAAIRDRQGAEARDAVWSHPDLMPDASDLDDPLGFAQGEKRSQSDDDFDAALGELLDGTAPESPESPESPDSPDDKGPTG